MAIVALGMPARWFIISLGNRIRRAVLCPYVGLRKTADLEVPIRAEHGAREAPNGSIFVLPAMRASESGCAEVGDIARHDPPLEVP